jgi:hypothetical protein
LAINKDYDVINASMLEEARTKRDFIKTGLKQILTLHPSPKEVLNQNVVVAG